MPNPSSYPSSTPLRVPDSIAGTVKWTPEVLARIPSNPGTLRASDFVHLLEFYDDNPFVKEQMLAQSTEFNGLFAPNPMYKRMLSPGYPARVMGFKSWSNGEAALHTPSSDMSLTFGSSGKIGTRGYQVTHTKLNAGLLFQSMQLMAINGAMSAAGFPSPAEIALEQVAIAWGRESVRMPFAQLMAMLTHDYNTKKKPYGAYIRSNFILDISADTSDEKYLVLLYGGPAIHYDSVSSPAQNNDDHPPLEVITNGAPGYGAGQRMYIERRQFYCNPLGHTWVGASETDVYPTREELMDFQNNWALINGAERWQYPFGGIVVNAAPGGAVTEDNCLNTDVVLEITQKWWGSRKSQINTILMPSAVETYLVRIGAMQYFPETMTGMPEKIGNFANRRVTVTDQSPFWMPDMDVRDLYKYLFPSNIDTRNEAIAANIMFMDGLEMY